MPSSATATFDSSTNTASCNTIAGTATSAFTGDVAATTRPASAIRPITGATPTNADTSSAVASRHGGSPIREKNSGRSVSSPPPEKTGPMIQPSIHTASAAASQSPSRKAR